MINASKKHKVIKVFGKRTSIRMEVCIWEALQTIAKREQCSTNELISLIYRSKNQKISLSSALRAFAVHYFQEASTEQGHENANHGAYFHAIARDMYLRKRQEAIDFNLHSTMEKY